jgi:hypothetical protein
MRALTHTLGDKNKSPVAMRLAAGAITQVGIGNGMYINFEMGAQV